MQELLSFNLVGKTRSKVCINKNLWVAISCVIAQSFLEFVTLSAGQ
jgi:hypothetical protein